MREKRDDYLICLVTKLREDTRPITDCPGWLGKVTVNQFSKLLMVFQSLPFLFLFSFLPLFGWLFVVLVVHIHHSFYLLIFFGRRRNLFLRTQKPQRDNKSSQWGKVVAFFYLIGFESVQSPHISSPSSSSSSSPVRDFSVQGRIEEVKRSNRRKCRRESPHSSKEEK
jgi:hypothetical protein